MGEGTGFFVGCAFMFILFVALSPRYGDKIEKACQGTPWVIEEPLIKKTLTCVVELKEKK